MAVSQRQIAERLGVSIALVSRVLSGKAGEVGIAAATIERVLATAAEMGYVPSAAALTLKGKGSRTVGVVVYDFLDPFFGPIIEQLQAQAHEHDYSLVLCGFKGRVPEASDLAALHKHAIDGVIVLGSDERADWLAGFGEVPVARIGHGGSWEASLRISVDEEDAAHQLMGYLSESGRHRLAFVGEHLPAHRLRYDAFQRSAEGFGCQLTPLLSSVNGFDAGLASARQVLEGGGHVDALICATDMIAMGALHALHAADCGIAVTGFDDIPAAARFIPPITTIRQPVEGMVAKAFGSILEPVSDAELAMPGTLVVRSSS